MRYLAILGFVAALTSSALAADMPTKAPPPVYGYPYSASGFYFGIGASSSAGSSTVANTGVFAAGAGVDLAVGYQWKGGLDFIAAEFDATYTNLGSAATCNPATAVNNTATLPCSTNSQWELEPLVKFGFPVTALTSLLPNLSSVFPGLPALPSGASTANQHPYIYAGLPVRDTSASYGLATGSVWTAQPEIGAGLMSQWMQGLVLDVRGGCSIGTTGFNLTGGTGIVGRATENTICQARLEVLY
jgi:hypothetical protein